MGSIRQLDSKTRDLIAAGEVIEAPFSVVRELWDNACDAGAKLVRIELGSGGLSAIRVADDGQGMDPEDAVLAFQRHATSKISSISDLGAVETLGFRGEALPSIAAVARVELVTRPAGSAAGTRVVATDGAVVSVASTGAPEGTTVIVSELFSNTPARRKSMLAPSREAARCLDMLRNRVLARPGVRLSVKNDGRQLLAAGGSGRLDVTLAELHGIDIADQLVPVTADADSVSVSGYVGRPSLNRANRGQQYVVINGRPVPPGLVGDTVEDTYRTMIPSRRFPVFVLHVTVPADQVDINVHPAKAEVRMERPDRVVNAVRRAVQEALRSDRPSGLQHPEPSRTAVNELVAAVEPEPWLHEQVGEADEGHPVEMQLEVLGQVADSYIVCRSPGGLSIIDQHAAHERVFLERLLTEDGPGAGQVLMTPHPVELPPDGLELIAANRDLLIAAGFELEEFGEGSLLMRAVPVGFSTNQAVTVLETVLEQWRLRRRGTDTERLARVSLAACQASVKAGNRLTHNEMVSLIEQLMNTEYPGYCAHGRPTVIELDRKRLDREFGRT